MIKNSVYKIFFVLFFAILNTTYIFAADLYKADAVVSYYGEKFHGKKTSNGETYNMYDLTCASKTLPFDTILKVTNLANGKSVQVRVNDRGPFVANRELDLSKAAAVKLDMIKSGTTHVRIEIVKKGPDTKLSQQTAQKAIEIMRKKEGAKTVAKKPSPKQEPLPTVTTKPAKKSEPLPTVTTKSTNANAATGKMYEIQVGAYKDKGSANHVGNQVMDLGIDEVVLRRAGEIYRVVIKNVSARERAKIEQKLLDNGFTGFVVKEL